MKTIRNIALLLLLTLTLSAAEAEKPYDWSGAETLSGRIIHAEIALEKPRPLKIHALKIDLGTPGLRLVTTGRAPDWGEPMPDFEKFVIRTVRQRTLDFVVEMRKKGVPVIAAVNAAPWLPWQKPYNHTYADHLGLAVSEGEVVCLPQKRPTPALVQRKDGTVEMREYRPGGPAPDVRTAVSGFTFILRDGKWCPQKRKNTGIHPRTFFGLSRDRKTLYLVTVDGRQPGYSEGMELKEGADLLLRLGAYDAINMDGGGSTTMVLVRKDKPELANRPSGGIWPIILARTVGNNLGIAYEPPKKKPETSAKGK